MVAEKKWVHQEAEIQQCHNKRGQGRQGIEVLSSTTSLSASPAHRSSFPLTRLALLHSSI